MEMKIVKLFQNFIERLDILITEELREGPAPMEEGSKVVQIMTIHSAKGKEFPIVILPSLNRTGMFMHKNHSLTKNSELALVHAILRMLTQKLLQRLLH